MSPVLKTLGEASFAQVEMVAICHKKECRYRQKVDLREVIQYVGAPHPILPAKGEAHFSERMRCPVCKTKGMFVWIEIPMEELPLYGGNRHLYRILDWGRVSGPLERELATSPNLEVARAAFDKARAIYPDKHFSLQQGARVIEDSRETEKPKLK